MELVRPRSPIDELTSKYHVPNYVLCVNPPVNAGQLMCQ